jgi:hypothetical protein
MHAAHETGAAVLAALAARAEAGRDFWAAARLYSILGRTLGSSVTADALASTRKAEDMIMQMDDCTLQTQWVELQLLTAVLRWGPRAIHHLSKLTAGMPRPGRQSFDPIRSRAAARWTNLSLIFSRMYEAVWWC